MSAACLLYARVPATSTPWTLNPQSPSSFVPPVSYVIDFLPASILFGLGSPGGVINVSTNRATLDRTFGSVSARPTWCSSTSASGPRAVSTSRATSLNVPTHQWSC